MNVFRAPPVPLPSCRDVEAERAALPRWGGAPWGLEMAQFLATREPFIYEELRRESDARERAASVRCPLRVDEGGGDNSATLALIRAIRDLVR